MVLEISIISALIMYRSRLFMLNIQVTAGIRMIWPIHAIKWTYFNPFLGKLIFVIWAFLGDIFNPKIFDSSPLNSHEHLMSFCYIKTKEPLHPVHTFSSTLYKYLNTCTYSCRETIEGVGSEHICSALVTFFQFLGHHLSTLYLCLFFSSTYTHQYFVLLL